ncbi:MAG: adenylyl-sulfate kinase [Nitrososphaeraceae archaeon]
MIREPKLDDPRQTGASYQPQSKAEGLVIWLTGLSGSGKTTTGKVLEKHFRENGSKVEFLDGDELRRTISSELGFSKEDRETHARRVAYLGQLLSRNGVITIVALISPYRAFREYARNLTGNFVEVWVQCSLETCIKRDPKGLYRNAAQGSITNMTGMQAPYEPPVSPEVTINTEKETPQECAEKIITYVNKKRK